MEWGAAKGKSIFLGWGKSERLKRRPSISRYPLGASGDEFSTGEVPGGSIDRLGVLTRGMHYEDSWTQNHVEDLGSSNQRMDSITQLRKRGSQGERHKT